MDYEEPQFFRVMQYAARADRDVVDMVSGNPDWDPPEGLRDGLRDYAEADADDYQYPPSVGLTELRDEIAARRGVDRSRVLVTNGAGEANHLAMTGGLHYFDGTEVLLADPVYPYYAGRANFLGADRTFVPVAEDNRLRPADVRAAASEDTAVIVVNSPNNPTGAVYGADAMAEFAAIAEENDALLVSDEVYDHFDFSGRFASALDADSPNVVATNSFSKTMAITGFRVGYAVFPPEDGPTGALLERARTQHMLTNVTGSRPAQYAVLRALETTQPGYYAACRQRLARRVDAFCDALAAAGAEYNRPEGGFYVLARFPDFPGTFENVYELIDEAGVAGMPGEAFGESRGDWIRFALVTPRVDEAAARLAAYFE
ncbi:pyridoxal phosphate-dependent aminotransferase [Haloarcula salina]|uniref:pyridoxal phosphate-dependent aminotransferase n=1 Tax=Haloarcula salina TaxID=1429914 RepID=UPI003C700B11